MAHFELCEEVGSRYIVALSHHVMVMPCQRIAFLWHTSLPASILKCPNKASVICISVLPAASCRLCREFVMHALINSACATPACSLK